VTANTSTAWSYTHYVAIVVYNGNNFGTFSVIFSHGLNVEFIFVFCGNFDGCGT